VNVTVALRAVVVGFGRAVNTTVPLPLPLVGVTDSQVVPVQVPATRHAAFEDTVMVWLPPAIADGAQLVAGDTVRVAATPAWVTGNDCVTSGLPLVVLSSIVPVRGAAELFA